MFDVNVCALAGEKVEETYCKTCSVCGHTSIDLQSQLACASAGMIKSEIDGPLGLVLACLVCKNMEGVVLVQHCW